MWVLAAKDEFYRKLHSCNRCFYCGAKLIGGNRVAKNHPRRKTKDHIFPLSQGGADDESNTVACCQSCNSLKADHPLKLFKALLAVPEFYFERMLRLHQATSRRVADVGATDGRSEVKGVGRGVVVAGTRV